MVVDVFSIFQAVCCMDGYRGLVHMIATGLLIEPKMLGYQYYNSLVTHKLCVPDFVKDRIRSEYLSIYDEFIHLVRDHSSFAIAPPCAHLNPADDLCQHYHRFRNKRVNMLPF